MIKAYITPQTFVYLTKMATPIMTTSPAIEIPVTDTPNGTVTPLHVPIKPI